MRLLLVLFLIVCAAPSFATTIKLRDDNVVQATIIDRSADRIKARVEDSIVYYDMKIIKEIDGVKVNYTPSSFTPLKPVSSPSPIEALKPAVVETPSVSEPAAGEKAQDEGQK